MNTIRAIHAFGGNIAIIGGILIADVETVANTAVHKSDSVHLLHRMDSGQDLWSPLLCQNKTDDSEVSSFVVSLGEKRNTIG